ncbi:hypothetical protein FRC17_003576 [Serendipita sp. 399]|nr:hypothetical protein FRC17_003576 [Serendipita sp. 399]
MSTLISEVIKSCDAALQASQPLFHDFPTAALLLRSQLLSLRRQMGLVEILDKSYHPLLRDLWKDHEVEAKLDESLKATLIFVGTFVENPSQLPGRVHISNQLKFKTAEEMEEAVENVRSLRREGNNALKAAVREVLKNVSSLTIEKEPLVTDFARSPLGVTAANLESFNATGRFLSKVVSQETENVVRQVTLHWSKYLSTDSGMFIQLSLLLVWARAVPTLAQDWSRWLHPSMASERTLIDQLETSIEQLDQSLRDAMVRNHTQRFRIAFVGVEGSGKSTLINYIIGEELLDVYCFKVGQATAYPCCIRHVPEIERPTLRIDGIYFTRCAKEIAAFNLITILDRFGREWKGEGLPEYLTNATSVFYLRHVYIRSRDTLAAFQDPEFTIQPIITGKDISKTLRIINVIAMCCLALKIPFECFAQSRWAIIEMNLPIFGDASNRYELLDLPGVYGTQGQIYWEELVRETLRDADAIIAVISAPEVTNDYDEEQAWRALPRVVKAGSHLAPSAIILTKSDSLAWDQMERKEREKAVLETFWPYSVPEKPTPVLECSPLLATSANLYISAHKDRSVRPDFQTIWDTPMSYVLKKKFGSLNYVLSRSNETIMEAVEDTLAQSSMDQTMLALTKLLSGIWQGQRLREREGLLVRLQTLKPAFLKTLSEIGVLDQQISHNGIADKASTLQTEWNRLKEQFTKDCMKLSSLTTATLKQGAASSLTSALLETRKEYTLHESTETVPVLKLQSLQEVRAFVRSVEGNLLHRLRQLEQEAEKAVIKGLQTYRGDQLRDLPRRVGELDAESEMMLIPLLTFTGADIDLVGQPITIPPDIEASHITIEIVALPPQKTSYREVQIRLLRRLTHEKKQNLEKLSPLSQVLLKLLSLIPFLYEISIKPKTTTKTHYNLDLNGLRTALDSVVVSSWSDPLSRIVQAAIMKETQRGGDLVADAIFFALSQAPAQHKVSTVAGSHELEPSAIRTVAAAFMNLVGSVTLLQCDF